MDILREGIPENVLTDSTKIKILDGIAGCGKTTYLSTTLEKNGTPYIHMTSTNRLKRDIQKRFPNRTVTTTASGLFRTENCQFYSTEAAPEYKTLVIDEVLQTHPNVIRWVMKNKGLYNIFLCTDEKQTLSPEQSRYMEKAYNELKISDGVIVYNPTITHRPVTKETENLYYESYRDSNNDGYGLFSKLLRNSPIMTFKNLDFSENDIYITHTNQLEDDLYKKFDLSNRYDLELIPKGTISSKEIKKVETYPILPQLRTKNSPFLGYFQQSNVGTVIRYQGSEVYPGQKLYYLVNRNSKPNDREIYTLITRMKDINSLVIVECPEDTNVPLVSFNNLEVVKEQTLILSKEENENIEKMDKYIFQQKLGEQNSLSRPEGKIYTSIIYDGHRYTEGSFKMNTNESKPKVSLTSLLKKDQFLKCDKMNEILRIVDTLNLGTYPLQPRNRRNEEPKKEQRFGVDLFGAYPSILKFGIIPDLTTFRPDNSNEVKLGIFTEDGLYKKGTWIMSPLFEELEDEPITMIGSFKRIEHTYTGDRLYTLYHKSVEDKQEAKNGCRWGFLEKKYLQKVKAGESEYYLIREKNQYELLMTSILSNLNFLIDEIRKEIYGSNSWGHQLVDCLYFDTNENIVELGERLSNKFFEYDFRISRITTDGKFYENEVLYQTYENLKTKEELKKNRKH